MARNSYSRFLEVILCFASVVCVCHTLKIKYKCIYSSDSLSGNNSDLAVDDLDWSKGRLADGRTLATLSSVTKYLVQFVEYVIIGLSAEFMITCS